MQSAKTFWNNNSVKVLFALVLLLILEMLFYSNRFFLTGLNIGEDIAEQDIPHASFLVRQFFSSGHAPSRGGAFPLWNPHKLCGIPFFEVSFMGPYYPFVFLYFLFPVLKAVNIGFLIHILLAGAGMLFLARRLKFSIAVSFFVASSWMLSSVFQQFSESGWLAATVATSYLPFFIYLFIRAGSAPAVSKRIVSLAAGLTLALIITGGDYPWVIIVLYSLLIFTAPSLGHAEYRRFTILAWATGIAASAVTWGPAFIQAFSHGYPAKTEGVCYGLGNVMNFLFPSDIRLGFTGRPGLILGLIGIFAGRMPLRTNFRLLFFASLFLMLFADDRIGHYELRDFIPFLDQVQFLWFWHIGCIFALIVFAGALLERIRLSVSRRRNVVTAILTAVICLQLLDLYGFNQKFYPKGFRYTLESFFRPSSITDILKQDASCFRISNRLFSFPLFRTNQGMLEGIDCFESRVRGVNLYKIIGESLVTLRLAACPLDRTMDLCNIKYAITGEDLPKDHFTLLVTAKLYTDPSLATKASNVYLYRNDRAFPRAFLLEVTDREAIRANLLDGYRDPLMTLRIPDNAWDMLSARKEASIQSSPNAYTIQTKSAGGGLVFLSEMFDRGWKVTIDGVPAETLSPFNFFMGVFVPAGTHTVVFRFAPMYFYVFAGISAITALLVTIAIVYCTARPQSSSGNLL